MSTCLGPYKLITFVLIKSDKKKFRSNRIKDKTIAITRENLMLIYIIKREVQK